MAVAVTCTGVRRINGNGYVRFGKREREFASRDELRRYVRGVLEAAEVQELLEALLLAKWLEADPNLQNPTLIEGRTITADLSINNLIRVT